MAIDADIMYLRVCVCADDVDANVDFGDDIHAWMNG